MQQKRPLLTLPRESKLPREPKPGDPFIDRCQQFLGKQVVAAHKSGFFFRGRLNSLDDRIAQLIDVIIQTRDRKTTGIPLVVVKTQMLSHIHEDVSERRE